MQWHDVRGWLSIEEGDKLAELATGKRVVEFGSYCGRSTLAMARTAKSILCLDWFLGDKDCGLVSTRREFCENTRHRWDVIQAIVGKIEDTGPNLIGTWDLAFIDSAHDYESACRDTKLAARLVPSGAIVWHDSTHEPISRAIAACGFTGGETLGSLRWIVRTS